MAALVVVLLAACGETTERRSTTYPPGWRAADHVVDSQVTNPRELLVVSTFDIGEPGEDCGPFYDDVLDHMGDGHGLVAVRERLGNSVAGPPRFPERPEHFRLEPSTPERGGCGLHSHPTFYRWWIPFRDAGRDFYAQVALGIDAPESLRRDAEEILDDLRFGD